MAGAEQSAAERPVLWASISDFYRATAAAAAAGHNLLMRILSVRLSFRHDRDETKELTARILTP